MPSPEDDLTRTLSVVSPHDPGLPHRGLVGDTCTILLSWVQTGGRYCLSDLLIPPGADIAGRRARARG